MRSIYTTVAALAITLSGFGAASVAVAADANRECRFYNIFTDTFNTTDCSGGWTRGSTGNSHAGVNMNLKHQQRDEAPSAPSKPSTPTQPTDPVDPTDPGENPGGGDCRGRGCGGNDNPGGPRPGHDHGDNDCRGRCGDHDHDDNGHGNDDDHDDDSNPGHGGGNHGGGKGPGRDHDNNGPRGNGNGPRGGGRH